MQVHAESHPIAWAHRNLLIYSKVGTYLFLSPYFVIVTRAIVNIHAQACVIMFSFHLSKNICSAIAGLMISVCLILEGTAKLFSEWAVTF